MKCEDLIYVVRGTTGEYSDRDEWLVAAFGSEAEARDWAMKAKRFADKVFPDRHDWGYDGVPEPVNPWDQNMVVYYTGTDYTVDVVPLNPRVTP